MRLPVLAIAVVLVGASRAHADSLDDFLTPRELAVGEAMRANATGTIGVDQNPAGIGLNREVVFEGGYAYRSTDSASLISASACDSTTNIPGCFFYHYAGTSPTVEGTDVKSTTHVAGISLSHILTPRILLGTTAKYYHFSTDQPGEDNASGFAVDAGLTVRLSELINLGVSMENIWASTDTPEFPRTFGGGVYFHPLSILSVSFDARWRIQGNQESARYGGGAELFLPINGGQGGGVPISAGALRDNDLAETYVSAGLGFSSQAWAIDVGGRRAVQGGHDNLIIASLRLYGPRLPTPALQ